MNPALHMYRRTTSERQNDGFVDVEKGGTNTRTSSTTSGSHCLFAVAPDTTHCSQSRTSYTATGDTFTATVAASSSGTTERRRNSIRSTTASHQNQSQTDDTVCTHATATPYNDKDPKNKKNYYKECTDGWMHSHWPMLLVSALVFVIMAGAGITLYLVLANADDQEMTDGIMDLATETGAWFAKELDFAILPLFSMAQFATELDIFADLPDQIKSPGDPGALPFLPEVDDSGKTYRNVTGVCDQPEVIRRFTQIATAVKHNAKMDGVLHNIQLAPQGVICLLHPMNNTEDFDDGESFLDNTGAWGIDLLHDSFHRFIARKSIKQDNVAIVGPRTLFQCPTCGMYFIIRLPVVSRTHFIDIDGEEVPRWGFATALVNWDALIDRSDIHERFKASGYEFQLTRTDHNYDDETMTYQDDIVVLASSDGFGTKARNVSTALQTTNNEWVITIEYDPVGGAQYFIVIGATFLVALFIAVLVYTVLLQKQSHTAMLGTAMAEKGKVELERKLTEALAHELRNPLSAIDSALATMPDKLPDEAKELIASMQLCSSFMSSIMNNLLDSRKFEEGKMDLTSNPMSLKKLINDVHKMMLPAVNSNVQLIMDVHSIPKEKEWVYGDLSRLEQVLTNILSNACKHTRSGSITISARWKKMGSKRNVAQQDEWVQLLCRDTGAGIPKEDQNSVFHRFTTRGGVPGSGLGLSIAKQIVDLYGGSIRFESDPTVKPGTDCIIMLPLKVCHVVPEELKPEAEKQTTAKSTALLEEPLRILLVDDIKMNRMMLKRRFLKCVAPHCTVSEAATGEKAIKICQTERFDIIVMDQFMQEAGGVLLGTDTIIALRRNEVDAVIIGCSGNDLDDKFLAAGAELVWKKPVPSNDDIIASLRRLLGAKGKLDIFA